MKGLECERCTQDADPAQAVRESVKAGALDPEAVITPGIYVDRVVAIASPAAPTEEAGQ